MTFPSNKDALYKNWLKWPDGFREVKNVTSLQTDRKTDRRTDGQLVIRKAYLNHQFR